MPTDFLRFVRKVSRLPKIRSKDGATLEIRVDNDAIQAMYTKFDEDGEELVCDVVSTWRGRSIEAVVILLQMREDLQADISEV